MSEAPRRLFVDHTHIRGHVTGIERVALDLFAPERLAPHAVRPVGATSVLGMIVAQQLGLPARGFADRSALLLFPGFPPAPLALAFGERCIPYIHDTFLLTRPDELNWRARAYMAPSFTLALRFGRLFLVNSRTTGAAVRAFCRPEACVALLRPPVRDVFGLDALPGPARYASGQTLRMLAIGTIEPRKDYAASLALTAALNAQGMPAELHIVGRRGWGRHAFLDAPPDVLTLHGYLADSELQALAGSCHLLLSTSKAEGLGLPLLEVQHGGLPVVAPEGDVFSEVLGGSGFFIRPHRPDDAAAALLAWIRAGGLAAASGAARANVARWNALAEADGLRFREFLTRGRSAYTTDPDALVFSR